MNCSQCGASNSSESAFCQNCGAALSNQPQTTYTTSNTAELNEGKSPNGTLILVFGILGLLVCQIMGIVAWVMANKEEKLYPDDQNVKIGKILGIIAVALTGVALVIIIFAMIFGVFAAVAGM